MAGKTRVFLCTGDITEMTLIPKNSSGYGRFEIYRRGIKDPQYWYYKEAETKVPEEAIRLIQDALESGKPWVEVYL